MYSFTRFWIGPKEARMLIQVRVVVRTTSDERQAVDADLCTGCRTAGSSRARSANWNAGVVGVEADEHGERHDPGDERDAERRVADELRPVVGQERDEHRAQQRQERDERDEREAGEAGHRGCPTISRNEPAMTSRPIAMPRA